MKLSIMAVFASAMLVQAAPVFKRQDASAAAGDIKILNFALTLENLESAFYQQGLSKFGEADFRRANFPNPTQTFQNFQHIAAQEAAHVTTLQQVITSLGGTPVPSCQFQFPVNTVQDFVRLASVLEKVGVSAYNGAVALLQNPDLQTAAASIDTVEARHASFINSALGNDPFSGNFDIPLDARQVITLASPLIQSCPFDLGVVPFGTLSVAPGQDILLPGGNVQVNFQTPSSTGSTQLFCNFLTAEMSVVMPLTNGNSCQIPPAARGDTLLMITNSPQPVSVKQTDSIVAGPAAIYVDTAHADSSTGSTVDAGFAAAASGVTSTIASSAANATATTSGSELTAASAVAPGIAALESQVASVQAEVAAAASTPAATVQNLVAPVAALVSAAPVIDLSGATVDTVSDATPVLN